jgi:hypothetical protein
MPVARGVTAHVKQALFEHAMVRYAVQCIYALRQSQLNDPTTVQHAAGAQRHLCAK